MTNPFLRFWAYLGRLGAPVSPETPLQAPTLAPLAREPVDDANVRASVRQDARVAFLNRRIVDINNANVTRDLGTHVEVVSYKPAKPLSDAETAEIQAHKLDRASEPGPITADQAARLERLKRRHDQANAEHV